MNAIAAGLRRLATDSRGVGRLCTGISLCLAMGAWGSNPSGDLRVEAINAYNLVVDSNVESPSTYAPRSAYLGARFCNDGTNALTNVVAHIGDYLGGSGGTPGTYPGRTQAPLVGPLPGGAFALTHEGGAAGTADATRYLGRLEPGECKVAYWLVSYPQTDTLGHAVWGPSVKPDDDLWLEYDIWTTAERDGSPIVADDTRRVTMRNEISAMANKIFPNTANKVPQEYQDLLGLYAPAWTNFASNGSPGTPIVTEGVWYDLGNVGQGFDNDGDLVPDRNLWMQPVGDPSIFDPSCFRLVRTYTLVIVGLKTGGEQVYVTEDQLYFENVPENNGAVGFVGYEFISLRSGCTAQLMPYQEVASGFDNEKFNGDYGAAIGLVLSSPTSAVVMAKDVDLASAGPGAVVSYTVAYSNSGALAVGDPGIGVPLVVQDRIPAGAAYVAGSATASNALPPGVSAYTILYSTNSGASWLATEPAPATNVTDIQWWLSDPLAPAAAGAVRFQAGISSPYLPANPLLVNTGALSFGSTAPFLTDTAETLVTGTNRFGDTVFVDDGRGGGGFGNQAQDGTEPGLSNVTVRLYFDANTNGVQDAGDVLLAATSTGAGGVYLFTNLADGRFLGVVDTADGDLPLGYTPSTPTAFAANLDAARTNAATVSFLGADFGFAPALSLDKERVGTNTLYEGRQVNYTISVTNRFAGNGSGSPLPCEYTVWATNYDAANSGTGQKEWLNFTNLFQGNGPDGRYALAPFNSAEEFIAVTDFQLGYHAGTITNVTILVPMVVSNAVTANNANDTLDVEILLRTNGVPVYTNRIVVTNLVTGTLMLNATAATNWSWADFNTNKYSLHLHANRSGQCDVDVYADAMGFRITSDQVCSTPGASTTLDPVPLSDTYDTNRLQFLSAVPPPDSVTAAGATGTLYWDNLGPIFSGGSSLLALTFKVLEPPGNAPASVTNLASVTNAFYANGRPANVATDAVVTAVQPAGTVGDFVWRDLDGDGVQDGGAEAGIAGVSIVLSPPAGVDLGGGAGAPVTNVTNAAGYYLFEGIPSSGTYTVTVLTATMPGGTATNTYDRDGVRDNRTVLANFNPLTTNTLLDVDFGYQVGSTIEGTIWHDLNRSATTNRDSGEDLLGGVTVYLCAGPSPCGAGAALATNVTDAAGYFRFVGNYAGSFVVSVNTNSGPLGSGTWVESYDTDGTGTLSHVSVTVVTGGVARADYSYYKTGPFSLGDTLFHDWNGDGAQDANEEGIASITMTLYEDANGNGVIDGGADALMATTATDVDGLYLFATLPPTNYIVVVQEADPEFPALYVQTYDPFGALNGAGAASITTSNRLDQDFGYRPYGNGSIGDTVWRDVNGDGLQSGPGETGISGVGVSLYVDANGDGSYVLLAVANTSAAGQYLFPNLPAGSFRVVVDISDPDLPDDAFGNDFSLTTPASYDAVLGGGAYLAADFGFASLGAIGDTIFYDANGNGTQDWNEGGVSNATVLLYRDINANGFYDTGTDVLALSANTDANGNYLFSSLATGRYVVVVSGAGPITNLVLSADPSADGVPCSDPGAIGCDGAVGVNLSYGTSFMGADFGYLPPGVIGDYLWLDADGDGLQDGGEAGIPFVTIQLYTNATLVASAETDGDGYYSFGSLADGTYTVVVSTNDVDFPATLLQTYDPDGVPDHAGSDIAIVGGAVVSIGGAACTNCGSAVDFGYRFAGANTLSGTVGLDALPYDGVLGTTGSGVSSNEAPFAGVQVFLFVWDDDGDDVVEAGETELISSALTTNNGDYAFAGLPDGDGNDRYLVSLSAPLANLYLTTTNGSTPAASVVNTTNLQGETVSAYQVVAIAPTTANVDFAFRSTVSYDFGDLPQSYSTRVEDAPDGARHVVPASTNLYLGATVDTEANGQPSSAADGDGGDEDGVVEVGPWREAADGGRVAVRVGAGAGWLTGYADFNDDGDFADGGEFIVSQVVSNTGGNGSGVYTNSFAVPAGSLDAAGTTRLAARFRLFASMPPFPEVAFSGEADNGEVEDYVFAFGAAGDLVWNDDNADGVRDPWEPPMSGVRVFVDSNGDGIFQTSEPSGVTAADGSYGIGGLTAGSYTLAVDTNTLPAGVSPVYDLDGVGTANRAVAAFTNGQVRLDLDFGYRGTAAIGDFVWEDLNTNGVQDVGEPGVAGAMVRLYSASSNLLAETQTGGGGLYAFTNLFPGTFMIGFVAPAGYTIAPRDQGGDASDSDADTNTGFTAAFAVGSGAADFSWDAGLARAPSPSFLIEKTLISPTNRPAAVGETIVFRIAVTNDGALPLNPVWVDDGFDTNYLGFVGANPTADVVGAGSVTWSNLGVLAMGQVTVITAEFAAVSSTGSGLTTNIAVGTATTPGGDPAGTRTSAAPVQVAAPSVGITKTVSTDTCVCAGSSLTFTVAVTNSGDVALTNVVVTDAEYDGGTRVVGDLAAGAVTSYVFAATVTNASNTAEVTGQALDQTVTNTAIVTWSPDTLAPTLTPPASITVECDAVPAVGTPTATDNCDAASTITYDGETRTDGACADSYTLTRTWTATDNCGNSTSGSQTITVADTLAPTLAPPASVTVECDAVPAVGTPTATDNCDAAPAIAYDGEVRTDGACADSYTLTRTWTATDNCGNSSSGSQKITVADTLPPTLAPPASVTVECDAVPAVGTPTASDNCDAAPAIAYDGETRIDGACPGSYTLTRTWTATDTCGNSASASQTIAVQDTIGPSITCPPSMVVTGDASCRVSVPDFRAVTVVSDNCAPVASIVVQQDPAPGTDVGPGTHAVVLTASDGCSTNSCSMDLTVVCPPGGIFIDKVADSSCVCAGALVTYTYNVYNLAPTPLTNVVVTDDFCSPVAFGGGDSNTNALLDTNEVWQFSCSVNLSASTTNTAWVSAQDLGGAGISNSVQAAVEVDTAGPVVTAPANLTVECDAVPAPGAATAADNCDTAPTIAYDGEVRTNSACPDRYTLTRTWTATDDCGNSASASQTILVVDTTLPVITVPPDVTVECDLPTDPLNTGWATVTDNCDPSPILVHSDLVQGGPCANARIITRVWMTIDRCSNSTSRMQTITVVDTQAPALTPPASVTVECDAVPAPGAATAIDNCDTDVTVSYDGEARIDGTCPDSYTLTRTWTAVDNCGNSASVSQSIAVVDTTLPVVTPPPDVTVECDTPPDPFFTGMASATDNCDGAPIVIYYDMPSPGACPNALVMTRFWMAGDRCLNLGTSLQMITVSDTRPPTITPPASVTVECDAVPAPGTATAADSCDVSVTVTYDGETRTDGTCPNSYTLTRTWTASDDCGNSASGSQTVTVQDTLPPIIFPPPPVTVLCGSSTDPSATGMATAVDNCDPAPGVSFVDNALPGPCPSGSLILRTWVATDACGNGTPGIPQLITVLSPALEVEKTVNGTELVLGTNGAPVVYNFAIRNVGDAYLTNVVLNDPALGILQPVGDLAVGQTAIVNIPSTISGDLTNTVTVTGRHPLGGMVSDEDTAEVNEVHPGYVFAKSIVSPTNRPALVGETMAFELTVINTGDVEFANVPIADIYDTNQLSFVSAVPPPLDPSDDGSLDWTASLLPGGGSATVIVNFMAVTASVGTNVATASPLVPPGLSGVPPQTSSVPYEIAFGSIGDTVWVDTNGNGAPDENLAIEGLNSVRVRLFRVSGGLTNFVAEVFSGTAAGQRGQYLFTNLPFGVYFVEADAGTVPPSLNVSTTPTGLITNITPDITIAGADFGFMAANPTAVDLLYFTAREGAQGVVIEWATGVEIDNLGFNVYRATARGGERVRVNGSMIDGTGSGQGRVYEARDEAAAAAGTYFYWLEDVEFDGDATLHGPVRVVIGADAEIPSVGFAAQAGKVHMLKASTMAEAGLPVFSVDADAVRVHVNGGQVSAYVPASGRPMQEGEALLFYVGPAADEPVEVTVDLGGRGRRMEEVYAGPTWEDGALWYGQASQGRAMAFLASPEIARYLLIGFADEWIWVFDVTDEFRPKMLVGAETLLVDGQAGLYLSYPVAEAALCLALSPGELVEITAQDIR
jgi:uncharacterized repeat protein (TIGR01451 family)